MLRLLPLALATFLLLPPDALTQRTVRDGQLYWEHRAPGHIVYSVRTQKRLLAFTFDDGPDPRYTPKILRILKRHGAHATFFVVGQEARMRPGLLRELVDGGNEIGNHTEHHRRAERLTAEEITSCDATIHSVVGVTPMLLRPPGGRLSDRIVDLAERTRHIIVMWTWDVDPRDWSQPGVSHIFSRVVDNVDSGDIVIFHDGGGPRTQTVEALDMILETLSRRGYTFVTVGQMIREWKDYRPYRSPSQLQTEIHQRPSHR
ncbi:MAG: polysaccharide deacetylase family protein [Bacilli bacterium]